jgi:hypothetical protein
VIRRSDLRQIDSSLLRQELPEKDYQNVVNLVSILACSRPWSAAGTARSAAEFESTFRSWEIVNKLSVRITLYSGAFLLLAALSLVLAAKAGEFLQVDAPRRSDVILVLAGETDRRPQRALELLSQGYGRLVVLDVPTNGKLYSFTQIDLAQRYIGNLAQGASVSVCPIDGLSTKDESKDAERCLQQAGAQSVLIVTSDFHTRRALDVFRREIPAHLYSVAASHDNAQFGTNWWTHRQWAKTLFDEWLRLIWWKAVDQWR